MTKKSNSVQSIALNFIEKRDNKTFTQLINRIKPGLNSFVYKYIQDKDKQGEHHYANQKLQSSNSERRNSLVDSQRVLGNHQQSRGNRSVQGTRSCIPEQTLLGHAEGTSVRQFDAHHQTSRGNKLRQC